MESMETGRPQTETPEEIMARERVYLVNWMRGVVAQKSDLAEQRAFMAKVHSVASHHHITLEELLEINAAEATN